MNKSKKIGIIAMMITALVWSISFINIKVAVAVVPPMTLGMLRFILASAILVVMVKVKKVDLSVEKRDWPYVFIAGALGITLYFYFENNGVKYTSASASSLIIATIPVFSVIADIIIYKMKFTKKVLVSIVCSLAGVALIVGFNVDELLASGYARGYGMMFGAVLSWIVYMIVTKPLFERYSQLHLLFYQSLIGMVCFIPFAWMEGFDYGLLTPNIVIHISSLGIFASVVGFYTYLTALDILGMSVSSVFLNLLPLLTVMFSMIFLHESMTLLQIAGGVLILISVFAINENEVPETYLEEQPQLYEHS
ncbi:MAG: DMT family transporter [Clostridia bacterium]|nr:DMT family transporter [Clostridia bacterium]